MSERQTAEQLCQARCVPCEGGVPRLTEPEAHEQLLALPEWELASGPDRIRRSWRVRHFRAAMEFSMRLRSWLKHRGIIRTCIWWVIEMSLWKSGRMPLVGCL